MFDFANTQEPECKSETFRTREFNLFKEQKKQILEFLKNSDSKDELAIDRNYAKYFLKRYVFGAENWNKLANFNKSMMNVLKSDKYKNIIERMLNNTSIDFEINNYLFRIDPVDIIWSSFKTTIANLNVSESISGSNLEYDLKNRSNDYDLYFDKDYFCFETDFLFRPLTRFHSVLCSYLDESSTSHIRYRILASNYKDKDGKLHQVLTLNSVQDSDSSSLSPIVAIIFYYAENGASFVTGNDDSHTNFINFQKHSIDLTYEFSNSNSYSYNAVSKNIIHIYHCDKPIFNELQQAILRTFYWINTRSKIEHTQTYNHEGSSATRRYFLEKSGLCHTEEQFSQFDEEYPMYCDNYFKTYANQVVIQDIETQWFTQLFFKTINKCLNSIENNHHSNSYEQDISYRFENYNSSMHSLGALYLNSNNTSPWKMGILNNIRDCNMVMILERILNDQFLIRDND